MQIFFCIWLQQKSFLANFRFEPNIPLPTAFTAASSRSAPSRPHRTFNHRVGVPWQHRHWRCFEETYCMTVPIAKSFSFFILYSSWWRLLKPTIQVCPQWLCITCDEKKCCTSSIFIPPKNVDMSRHVMPLRTSRVTLAPASFNARAKCSEDQTGTAWTFRKTVKVEKELYASLVDGVLICVDIDIEYWHWYIYIYIYIYWYWYCYLRLVSSFFQPQSLDLFQQSTLPPCHSLHETSEVGAASQQHLDPRPATFLKPFRRILVSVKNTQEGRWSNGHWKGMVSNILLSLTSSDQSIEMFAKNHWTPLLSSACCQLRWPSRFLVSISMFWHFPSPSLPFLPIAIWWLCGGQPECWSLKQVETSPLLDTTLWNERPHAFG